MRSKKGLILMLALVVVLQSVIVLSAEGQVKTKTVVIESTKADESNLSREINIPNLKKVVSITTSTGNVTHNVNGEKITINVNGGKPSRSVKNSKKHSKEVKDYSTSSSNSFNKTKGYNDNDGYKGTLSKDGNSYVISGSYISKDSKHIDRYLPITKTFYVDIEILDKNWAKPIGGKNTTIQALEWENDNRYRQYNEDGYMGNLEVTMEQIEDIYGYKHMGQWIDDDIGKRTWRESTYIFYWSGTITRPASDTRVYRQNYKGIAYKEGFDNYYKYETTIKYIDNSAPTLNLLYPKNKVIRSSVSGYNTLKISGTVKDIDIKDILTVKYQLSTGATGDIQTLTANGSDQSFNADVNVSSLKEGDHKIYIWVEDNQGAKSNEISRAFSIDKTPPVITINPYNTEWTNQNITVTATVDKGALNQESYTFTENGSFTFIATDIAGNVTKKIVTITNIDKELPTMTIKVDK